MYGLAAIQQANGWAMAGAGACIVLSGLALLAFLISMLPRLTGLFEPKILPVSTEQKQTEVPSAIVPEKLPADVNAAALIYISLTESLGKRFSLIELHIKSRELNLPHPHLSINRFRDAGILVADGEGLFSWNPLSD